jgi:succinyl-diaminopimelate desuccinylase
MADGLLADYLPWIEVTAWVAPGRGMLAARGSSAVARLARVLAEIDPWNDERADPPPTITSIAAHAGEHGLRRPANVGRIEGGAGAWPLVAAEAGATP